MDIPPLFRIAADNSDDVFFGKRSEWLRLRLRGDEAAVRDNSLI
jgi:hypothetical protein